MRLASPLPQAIWSNEQKQKRVLEVKTKRDIMQLCHRGNTVKCFITFLNLRNPCFKTVTFHYTYPITCDVLFVLTSLPGPYIVVIAANNHLGEKPPQITN